MRRITIEPEKALDQAGGTIMQYMHQAIHEIDKEFGGGYAKGHPELLGAMIKAQAIDFNTTMLCAVLQDIDENVTNQLSSISSALFSAGTGIEDSLNTLATNVEYLKPDDKV